MADFNPIKETVDGKKAHSMIWSTAVLEKALEGLRTGRKLIANPFYENNTKLLKGDLVFKRTKEEIAEWKKCKNDIIYFANTYCKLMTPAGIRKVQMRDYQEKYLEHLEQNRLSIFLSCRQSGKCISFLSKVNIEIDFNTCTQIKPEDVEQYRLENGSYAIPLYVLYSFYDKSLKWKIEKYLYRLLEFLIKNLKKMKNIIKFLISLISFLDSYDNQDEKLVKSFILDGIKINGEGGEFYSASYIHKTKKFKVYEVVLSNGMHLKCADNHLIYTKGMKAIYAKDLTLDTEVITTAGLSKVVYVKEYDEELAMCDVSVLNDSESYYSNGILSHNTTTSAIFLLHYILFNTDKNSLVLGNKRATAVEILSKLKKIFFEIPFFLKPGIYKWNEGQIALDNGCMCMAEATTINSGISFTFHCVLADEFAHIQPNIIEKFYNNLFPTITAGKARFIISSTQNGYNLFYRLWCGSVAKENEYASFKVDWWQVPEWNPDLQCFEKRDEKWHRLQIANYGGEENFNKQFGTNFSISSNTLVNNKYIQKCQDASETFINKDLPGVIGNECFFWKPDYEPVESLRKDYLVLTIDIAEGIEGDYTVITFNKMLEGLEDVDLETVGFFRCNDKEVKWCAQVLRRLCMTYMDINKYIISLEMNLYGELFINYMMEEINRDLINVNKFNEDVFVRYTDGKKQTIGTKVNHQNKLKACKLFKNDFEMGRVKNVSDVFIAELSNFCDMKGTGVYKATFGHDDTVMSQIQIEFVKESISYKNLIEEFKLKREFNNEVMNPYELFDDRYLDYYANPIEFENMRRLM